MDSLSYRFEYSKTSRSCCQGCGTTLAEGKLKVGKEVVGRRHDGIDVEWYHLECLPKEFKETKMTTTKGWDILKWKDLTRVRNSCTNDLVFEEGKEEELKQMNIKFWGSRNKLKDVTLRIQKEFLKENGRPFVGKVDSERILDEFTDILTFGLLGECPQCHQTGLKSHLTKLVCSGNMNEFTKCDYVTNDINSVPRYKAIISDKLKKADKTNILKEWEFPDDYPTEEEPSHESGSHEEVSINLEEEEEDELPQYMELYGMNIYIQGNKANLKAPIKTWQEMIKKFGGNIAKNVVEASVCLTTNKDIKQSKTVGIRDAKDTLTCLKVKWLDAITDRHEGFMKLRTKEGAEEYLCEGCTYKSPIVKVKYHKPKEVERETFKPTDDSDVMKVTESNWLGIGTTVYVCDDPVFGWTAYNVILNKTDLDTGANSMYHMQIVKNKKGFKMMFEWGRIGANLSRTYRESKKRQELLKEWEEKFEQLTGNEWDRRHEFKKMPGKYYMQALDTGKDAYMAKHNLTEEQKQRLKEKTDAMMQRARLEKMDSRVSDLIEMIFDKEMMEKGLEEAGLNIKNLPLGKIKLEQMKEALKILTELSNIISDEKKEDVQKEDNENEEEEEGSDENGESDDSAQKKKQQIKDLTTKYYYLVPHSFYVGKIVLIDNIEKVKKEIELIEMMCDVAEAMQLMDEDDLLDYDQQTEIFSHYDSLHTKITALDKKSERFKLLEQMFTNNQETNSWGGGASVSDIFEIVRNGEKERFEGHSEESNRQLLYHGSRLANFVGILSTGLRIAPPEAPCNGYRYGKGIYFANCASKSIAYCSTNDEGKGCILLCEVALGTQWETAQDKYMEKPQPGSDSTYALGMAEPDPKETVSLDDGVKVAKGKIISTKKKTANSHSELVVYDETRVKIRYLIIFEH